MAELGLRERLQPALLDRLLDDERQLTIFEISIQRAELTRLQLPEKELLAILTTQGLEGASPAADKAQTGAAEVTWALSAPAGRVSLAQLKALVLKPRGAPQGVALQSFCRIETRNVLNTTHESADRRYLGTRRLREYVSRDLVSLLNAMSYGKGTDLARYPQVRDSVLNYGMPSLAGVSAVAVDPARTAADIADAIRRFEPRLQKVHVSAEQAGDAAEGHQLSFRIEAELWGQPVPLPLLLRTRINTENGLVTVADAGAR